MAKQIKPKKDLEIKNESPVVANIIFGLSPSTINSMFDVKPSKSRFIPQVNSLLLDM